MKQKKINVNNKNTCENQKKKYFKPVIKTEKAFEKLALQTGCGDPTTVEPCDFTA